MPSDNPQINERDLILQMIVFEQNTGLTIQFHNNGKEDQQTFHWADPLHPEDHNHKNPIIPNYFTTIQEAVNALKLVNTIFEKTNGELFDKVKQCYQCGKNTNGKSYCSDKCISKRLHQLTS